MVLCVKQVEEVAARVIESVAAWMTVEKVDVECAQVGTKWVVQGKWQSMPKRKTAREKKAQQIQISKKMQQSRVGKAEQINEAKTLERRHAGSQRFPSMHDQCRKHVGEEKHGKEDKKYKKTANSNGKTNISG